MKVAIYHDSIPNQKNQEKIDLLRFFSEGVSKNGDQAIDVRGLEVVDSDIGVIQGWISHNIKRPHLKLREQVILNQHNTHTITADSNLFLYANKLNPHHYLRYSFDGVFPNTGCYCDSIIDPDRWRKIAHAHRIEMKPWREKGDHILLLLQRNDGWSMGTFRVPDWINQVVAEIRQHTDRPIKLRPHPNDSAAPEYLRQVNLRNVTITDPKQDLRVDLLGCWAAVNHNSSPVIGAAIEGVPVFVTDTIRSQAADIANNDFSKIEDPVLADRQAWVERLAMSHWNFDELNTGEAWAWMRQFV